MTSQVNFSQMLADVYEELLPALISIAKRSSVSNPHVVVDAWRSRAFEIVDKFDKGDLVKKVYVGTDNQDEMETYDPNSHDTKKFILSLKNYLKVAFKRDVVRMYKDDIKNRDLNKLSLVSATTSDYSLAGGAEASDNLMRYDSIRIDDLMSIIQNDADKIERNQTCVLNVVEHLFVMSVLGYCEDLKARGDHWKNMVVVTNIEEKDNKKFFSYDFRSELEHGVRLNICKAILKDSRAEVLRKLSVLIDVDSKSALQKRLFRYLYTYRGGFPSRLRKRVKMKTL